MGSKLFQRKFTTLVNPYGTIFNPITLSKTLSNAIEMFTSSESDLVALNDLFYSFEHHSTIRGENRDEVIDHVKRKNQEVKSFLENTSHLILTFGTAWVYEKKDTGLIVANCHKQDSNLFVKRLLSLEEMKGALEDALQKIYFINPEIKLILTVSPVRHTKDGIPENQVSKSLLRVLCQELTNNHPNSGYFPAFEIMMDELRDYRFYKRDKIHPSEEAEDYIWVRWRDSHMGSETIRRVSEIEKINLELAHRAFNPDSESHQRFLKNLLHKMEQLSPDLDFSEEINQVKNQIHF